MNTTPSRNQTITLSLPIEDRLPVTIVKQPSQSNCPFHSHDSTVELVVVLSGTGTHIWKNHEGEQQSAAITAGDVFVVHEYETHRYVDVHDLDIINLIFKPPAQWLPVGDLFSLHGYHALFHIEPYLRRAYNIPSQLKLINGQLDKLVSIISLLESEIAEKKPGYVFAAKGIMMHLLTFICRKYPNLPNPNPLSTQSRALDGVAQALCYIESHFSEEISLEKLRTVAKMSHSGLLRAFRLCVGQSPIEYLIQTRISKAKQLLGNPSLNVSEVSMRVGFNDPNYFSRKFKAITQRSPRQYRRTLLEKAG